MSAEAESAPMEVDSTSASQEQAAETPADESKNGDVSSETPKVETKHTQPSGKTVFVLNLPTSMLFTFADELKEIFSKYGEIKCIKRGGVTVNGQNSDLTLTAFINFANAESSEKSVVETGRIVGGNPIEVFVLRAGPNSIVVDNTPVHMSVECLKNLLSACGPIKEAVKIPGRRTAFVEFETEEGLNKAISLNSRILVNNIKLSIEKRGDIKKSSKKQNRPGKGRVDKRPIGVGFKYLNYGPGAGGGGGGGGGGGPAWGGNGPFPRNRGGSGGGGGGFRGGRGPRSGGGGGGGGGGFGGGYNRNANFWNTDGFRSSGEGGPANRKRKQQDWVHQPNN